MGTRDPRRTEIPPGTLDMLILKTLCAVPCTATASPSTSTRCRTTCWKWRKVRSIPRCSAADQGWVSAEWGQSANNRRARFYRVTAAGRKQLESEVSEFDRVMRAITRVIQPA